MMTKVLDHLTIGEAVASGPIFMCPLWGGQKATNPPLAMDEALALDLVEFSETSLAGNVSELVVENRGVQSVFLLDGEQILGLKQNRTFNLSMLLPPRSKTVIPVSCLEAGRWAARADRARAAEHVHFASGRANKLRSVSESLRCYGEYHSDQGRVWSDIDRKFEASCEASPTAAEADFYGSRRDRLETMRSPLAARPGQIGAAMGVGNCLVGIDVFLTPELYASAHDKLLKSYLLDAVDERAAASPPGRDCIHAKIRALFAGKPERFESPGTGEALRWSDNHGSAAALIAEGICVHAVAFCHNPNADLRDQADVA